MKSPIRSLTILSTCLLSALSCSTAIGAPVQLTLNVIDSVSQQAIPARLYLQAESGEWHFFKPSSQGSAVQYQKQNWINDRSVEYHTTVSADSMQTSVPKADYRLTVESGKSYFPREVQLSLVGDQELTVQLTRWNNPTKRGWYSGDTHLHREVEALKNVVLAEDLNVALPLTNWVTVSNKPPSAGDKNLADIPSDLIQVDGQHVIWPRNTEYEIFTVGEHRHTLGALFVLGHRQALDLGVPPWKPVIESVLVSDPDALFDLDKLDWPFAMLLPTVAPHALYELSNNHVWRTEFAFRKWNTRAPAYIQPPFGSTVGGHRQWLDYTMGMYYTLLNCGFRMAPSAGTANGVHPVPAGFGRVYVHMPKGFSFRGWMKALKQGRSFVTTGPMLYATANANDPGHIFQSEDASEINLKLDVISETPLSYGEVLVNGKPVVLLRPTNVKTSAGAFRSELKTNVSIKKSGWFAVRFWEPRADGQSRFVHSAPWYAEIGSEPVRCEPHERQYLIKRLEAEMERSNGIVSFEAQQEYERALAFYQSLPVEEGPQLRVNARPLAVERRAEWLDNMILHHRFSADEVRQATGISREEAQKELLLRASHRRPTGLRILPYPCGRHPRIGFLDGATNPQRETKISIFAPWSVAGGDGGYVVVDVPEAIFSNLGLAYLAHTHIPTIWRNELPRLEWKRDGAGYRAVRTLPNGIRFSSEVSPDDLGAKMKLSLYNGTDEELSGLRVQVCTMLKGAVGFNLQEELASVRSGPFLAVRAHEPSDEIPERWIITAWWPNQRLWTNPPVPCIHSDPILPDCKSHETVTVEGGLWFFEGRDIEAKIKLLRDRIGT